jgi:hypothetical protein
MPVPILPPPPPPIAVNPNTVELRPLLASVAPVPDVPAPPVPTTTVYAVPAAAENVPVKRPPAPPPPKQPPPPPATTRYVTGDGVGVVIELEAADAALVPTVFVAVTVNV